MLSQQYQVVSAAVEVEEEFKGSKFVTLLFSIASPAAFREKLDQIKHRYPGANHYCQAFVASIPGDNALVGFSDDGEPAGSAGRPMLNVLSGANVGFCGVVSVRYFGGTKLGVGGLVRAYGSGVKLALANAKLQTREPTERVSLNCGYSELGSIEHFCAKHELAIENKQFADQVALRIQLPLSCIDSLCEQLQAIHPMAIKIIKDSKDSSVG